MRTTHDIRQDLVWTRDELTRRLQRLRDDAGHRLLPLSADAGDRAQETQNDEVLDRLECSTLALVNQYQHAIARIDQGLYGFCEECDYPIEAGRLEAVPQATRCGVCASDAATRAAA
ncbi:MAG: TraR/DksA family transcriptional regulator [Gammaproteobacteria bacterium]